MHNVSVGEYQDAPPSARSVRRAGWRDVVGTLGTAGRLLARHWPLMLTAALLGMAFRNGVIWAAVELSAHVPWLAQLVLVLAPIGYLLPVVFMLRLCARDLKSLSAAVAADAPESPTEGREQRLVDVAVSVLVPFLAVYTTYDLLQNDRRRFINTAAADEFFSGGGDFIGRLQLASPLWMVLGIIVVAFIIRWLLGRVERIWRFVGLAFVGALIELYWTVYVSEQIDRGVATSVGWFMDRDIVVSVTRWWAGVADDLGWAGVQLDASLTWFFGLFGQIGTVIIVPIAWLLVAAVVLGHRLMPPTPADHPLLDRATRALPAPVRSAGESLAADVGSRWGALFAGIGLVVRAGFVPILTFCVLFLIPNLVPAAVRWGARLLIGPQETSTFLAFAPWEDAIGLALQLVVTAPLVAAALDRFVTPLGQPVGLRKAVRA